MRPVIPLTLAFTLALAVPASAEHCIYDADEEIETPATGVSIAAQEVGGEDPGIYYIDTSVCQPQCLFDLWIYEETNGWPGLQRGDELASSSSSSLCCGGDEIDECQYLEADTIIF